MKHDNPSFEPTTQKVRPRSPRTLRITLPCLTILGHPDRRRIGERAPLKALLAGQVAHVSRLQPAFGPAGGTPADALLDAALSRTPLALRAEPDGAIAIDPNGVELRIDGVEARAPQRVPAGALELGVVLELSNRVVLLLHRSSNRVLTPLPLLIGQSDAIDDVRREIASVADLATPVLLRGETGTGKQMAAQTIHACSPRAKGELVALNMAAVPEATAVSVLFGHARGAFTGADRRHRGAFENAAGGTLFLDELGETPAHVQPMLLRAVETSRIQSLGDDTDRPVDVRIVAATDSDLAPDGGFSAALLHRLAGYEIQLPPLRARREDIALLFITFVERELRETNASERLDEYVELLIESGFLARLVLHPLPGNVRQLRNVARHLVISNRVASDLQISPAVERQLKLDGEPMATNTANVAQANPSQASAPPAADSSSASALRSSTRASVRPEDISEEQLLDALRAHAFAPARAAASLGIPNSTIHGLMQRSGLVRRAADLSDDELRAAFAQWGSSTRAMAEHLSVSERALRIVLKQRGLVASD